MKSSRNLSFRELKNNLTVEKILFISILIINLGIVYMCLGQGISGNDYWWHVKTGEWIVHNGRIPNKDIFSWLGINLNIDWIPHEWLSDVIFYFIYRLGGHLAIFIFVLILASCFIVIIHFIVRKVFIKNVLVVSCFLVLMTGVVCNVFYPRPQIFSYYLSLLVVWCLSRFIQPIKTKPLFIIPVITVLWSNLHGGFAALSYVLCLCLLIVTFIPAKGRIIALDVSKKTRLKILAVFVLTVLAILVNPLGIKVLIYPFLNQGDNLMMTFISEWNAPDCKNLGELLLYFVPIASITIAYVCNNTKIKLIDFVLFCLFVFLFLRSVRFIMLWYIFALFGGLKYMPPLKIKKNKKPIEYITKACTAVAAVVFLFYGITNGINSLKTSAAPIKRELSDQIIQCIKNEASETRLFNDYDYGGELIFNDIPVFFDSRADLFASQSIMKDGMEMLFLEPCGDENTVDINKMIKKYKIDRILVRKNRPLYTYLNSNKEVFSVKCSDENSAYFECKINQNNND